MYLSFLATTLPLLLSALPSAQAQTPPPNLTGTIISYTNDRCTQGYFGTAWIQPGQCVQLVNGSTTSNTVSLEFYNVWEGGAVNPTVGHGVGTVWKAPGLCATKVLEIRKPGCVKVTGVQGGVTSFSWRKETYTIPKRSVAPVGVLEARRVESVERSVTVRAEGNYERSDEGCRGPEFFVYRDEDQGIERRIELGGSLELGQRVAELYEKRDYAALNEIV